MRWNLGNSAESVRATIRSKKTKKLGREEEGSFDRIKGRQRERERERERVGWVGERVSIWGFDGSAKWNRLVQLPGGSGVRTRRDQGPPNGFLPVAGRTERRLQLVAPRVAGVRGQAAPEKPEEADERLAGGAAPSDPREDVPQRCQQRRLALLPAGQERHQPGCHDRLGVFDGHGPNGHMVAKEVRDILPLKLRASWEVNIGDDECKENNLSKPGSMDSEETSSVCLNEEFRASIGFKDLIKRSEIIATVRDPFLKAFRIVDKELRLHPDIDCFYSGTTAVTLVKQGQDLVIGNVGDSRAVLGTRDHNNSLVAVQLTVDLKPNLPREAERIRRCRGRVFALRDEPEVARLWLPNANSPGLAMARAFGDFCLKDFGLISVPEISYRRITEKDEFIVLATDGVWDVLSNKEVVDIVAMASTRSCAARYVVESAGRAWRLRYPTSRVDDCAVVCLFLNTDSSNSVSAAKAIIGGSPDGIGVLSDEQEPPQLRSEI
ncbi:phosphatase 2C [Musa troglodytarum]|uniref:protein-serine/threonine phosphatase n=1 Tax=Musa troglodytarum TaxID=320322 RepID=A0A9E7KNY1_9LILI|nr:phosphatase 2C [Musa troglodytarum]